MKSNVQPRPHFFWQGFLILLPLAVLAVLGVSSLRQDRSLVEQEARENAKSLAGQFADYISPRLDGRVWGQYHWAIQAQDRNPPAGTQMSHASRYSEEPNREIVEEFNIPMPQYRRLLAGITNYGRGALEASGWTPRMIVDPNGNLLWPPPYPLAPSPALPDGTSLTPELSQRVEAARASTGSNALAALESLLSASQSPQLAGNARLELSRRLAVAGRTNEAFSSLSAIATTTSPLTSEAGIPLQPLASLDRLRLLNQGDVKTLHEAATQLASNAVIWPSLLTPSFLEEAVRAWPGPLENGWESDPASWRQRWWVQEDARSTHAHLLASGVLPVANQKRAPLWTIWRNEPWLLVPSSDVTYTNKNGSLSSGVGFQIFPEVLVEMALLELLDQSRLRVPDYAVVSFDVSNRTWPTNAGGAVLAEAPMTWDHRGSLVFAGRYHCQYVSLPGLMVRVRLAKPEFLFALQRQRAILFGGLIVVAALVSLAGVLVAHRAFHRQLQLNEAKSNFVSSVSHELRAPIASVRLLAESLARGKVEDTGKQHEYFGFIVQECQRLSSLIENVLDFSRIEQGRKQYDFEPTDLRALAEQTVKLMESYAEEKGVRLELGAFNVQHSTSDAGCGSITGNDAAVGTSNLEPRTSNFELIADGKALQQALVNLIDNAIKHSPKGEIVTVGLEASGAKYQVSGVPEELRRGNLIPETPRLALSVTDHGPGIPHQEHARIFERFYRRGTELRRETQGVGIGLSIVKHIVEAHGGRVRVESAPGQGSRFTIELPLQK